MFESQCLLCTFLNTYIWFQIFFKFAFSNTKVIIKNICRKIERIYRKAKNGSFIIKTIWQIKKMYDITKKQNSYFKNITYELYLYLNKYDDMIG